MPSGAVIRTFTVLGAGAQIIPFSHFYEIGFGEVSGIDSTKSNIMIHHDLL